MDHGFMRNIKPHRSVRQEAWVVLILLCSSMTGCFGGADEILPEDYGIPGGLTLACLSSDRFTSMVVEVDHTSSSTPTPSALQLMKSRLEDVCDKPGGVTIQTQETTFEETGTWSDQEVRDIGHATRSAPPQGDGVLRWHVLYPTGNYQDDSVLGVAVDASTIAIFQDTIEGAENFIGRPSAEDIEEAVLVHEIGHLLGLVNIVYTSPHAHEDPDHPHHSNNDQSVMYWAVESTSVANLITGTVPNDFDADDRDDLIGLADGRLTASDQLWEP